MSGYGNRFLEDTSATARPPATVGTKTIGGMFRNGRAAITLVKGRVRELVGDGTADEIIPAAYWLCCRWCGSMLRHLEPNTLDTEPLLLNYPVRDDELDEDGEGAATEDAEEDGQVDEMARKTGGGGAAKSKTWRRRRRLSKQVSYRSGTQGVVLRQGDMLVRPCPSYV